jgi:hypothetical protein
MVSWSLCYAYQSRSKQESKKISSWFLQIGTKKDEEDHGDKEDSGFTKQIKFI